MQDKRVVQHFCRYKLDGDDGVGAVVLDYNHAVDHVCHCLNSMKKFGLFTTVKVESKVCLAIAQTKLYRGCTIVSCYNAPHSSKSLSWRRDAIFNRRAFWATLRRAF